MAGEVTKAAAGIKAPSQGSFGSDLASTIAGVAQGAAARREAERKAAMEAALLEIQQRQVAQQDRALTQQDIALEQEAIQAAENARLQSEANEIQADRAAIEAGRLERDIAAQEEARLSLEQQATDARALLKRRYGYSEQMLSDLSSPEALINELDAAQGLTEARETEILRGKPQQEFNALNAVQFQLDSAQKRLTEAIQRESTFKSELQEVWAKATGERLMPLTTIDPETGEQVTTARHVLSMSPEELQMAIEQQKAVLIATGADPQLRSNVYEAGFAVRRAQNELEVARANRDRIAKQLAEQSLGGPGNGSPTVDPAAASTAFLELVQNPLSTRTALGYVPVLRSMGIDPDQLLATVGLSVQALEEAQGERPVQEELTRVQADSALQQIRDTAQSLEPPPQPVTRVPSGADTSGSTTRQFALQAIPTMAQDTSLDLPSRAFQIIGAAEYSNMSLAETLRLIQKKPPPDARELAQLVQDRWQRRVR